MSQDSDSDSNGMPVAQHPNSNDAQAQSSSLMSEQDGDEDSSTKTTATQKTATAGGSHSGSIGERTGGPQMESTETDSAAEPGYSSSVDWDYGSTSAAASATPTETTSIDASSSASASSSAGSSSGGLNQGQKIAIGVGVGVGGALVIIALFFLIFCLRRRKQRNLQDQQAKDLSRAAAGGPDHSGIDMTSASAPVDGWSTPVAPPVAAANAVPPPDVAVTAPTPAHITPAAAAARTSGSPRFPFEKATPRSQSAAAHHPIGTAVTADTPDDGRPRPATTTGFYDIGANANHSRTQSPFNDPDDDAMSAVSRFSDRQRGAVGTGSIRSAVSAVSDDDPGHTTHGHGNGRG